MVCSSAWSTITRFGLDPALGGQRLDDDLRALVLVLEVRRVDVDRLLVANGQVDVVLEGRQLVAGDAVEADLADAEHVRPVEEFAG